MKPSILFDARLVLERPTGIGQYICSLLPEMLRLAPDWQFHLLLRPDSWPGYCIQTWTAPNLMQHFSQERYMSLRQRLFLPQMAQELRVDLLHYPHFDAPVLFGRVPVVVTLHDAKYLVRPDFFTSLSWLKRQYMRYSFGQSLRRAAAVITISHATSNDLSRIFAAPLARMNVIYEAADPQFRPAPAESIMAFQEKYGLKRQFLLTVGERRPHKNHLGLLQAYADSQSRLTHDLVIIGQPYQDYTAPEEFVRARSLEQQVHFLSGVSFSELIAAYTAADLFVLVSFYEGFGLPILEAMACDTPVIASNTTAAGEIVGAGGLAVDPRQIGAIRQAMDSLLGDAVRRQALVRKGRIWRQRFSWQQAAAQTLAVYRRVLEGP